jgi:hypothetical protein
MLSFGWAESVVDGGGSGQSRATIPILAISILQAVKMFVRRLARRNEDNLLMEGSTYNVGWRQGSAGSDSRLFDFNMENKLMY